MTSHRFKIKRETSWPFQLVASCNWCGVGIRCNHEHEAREFFANERCR